MLESVGYEYACYLDIALRLLPGLQVREARVIGGGARSALWNRIKADILGVPYVTLDREEFATLGSAVLAGYAVGVFPDLRVAVQHMVHEVDRIEPDPERHTRYRQFVQHYRRLLDVTRPLFDALAAT